MSTREADPSRRRVLLTGAGVLSSVANGVTEYKDALRAGRVGTAPITLFDTAGFQYARGHQVSDINLTDYIHRVPLTDLGRASQFSVAAARMAVTDAELAEEDLRSKRGLIAIGTTDGEGHDLDHLAETVLRHGPDRMEPEIARRAPALSLSMAVAKEFRLSDVEVSTIPTACSAGNYALGSGFDAVRSGEVDYALVGGTDGLCRKNFAGFYRLGLISPDECRPFDADREGLLTGEGAGVMVLESEESALARGAHVYAEILGYGLNCDAHHPTAPEEDSVARCIRLALDDAGLKPEDVDLISAHGTGTKTNDLTETRAIQQVYGATPPPMVGIKSMIGHTMGAASALGAIAGALAITHGFIPPTANHRRPDPECPIDCVPNQSLDAEVRIVQNNGLAFGGNNAVVMLGKYAKDPC
ncbi:beta-ketoacyl-[acyl-carrier-protein] synthase family protein [Streptomyces milbemycinicus]|uniref:Beta-ketoacyl-[acyl-carrier-protein] synthase family protein n=1 Tax=Streptomyces milbemycinicus TaxID=476552 RepID=A0ABW8M4M2_9ACTN